MGDKVCREKTFYFKPADGPGISYKGVVCEEKKPEKAEAKAEEKCWYEERQMSEYVKPADGPGYFVPRVARVKKCGPVES